MQERGERGQLDRVWLARRTTLKQRSVFVNQPVELLTFYVYLLTEFIRHAEVRLPLSGSE